MINSTAITLANKKLQHFVSWHLRNGSFLRNLSIVMSGTAMAQLISFASMPVVSHLFSPSDFGIFGSFNSVLGVLSAAITLQYTQAIVLPKHKKDAINLFFVSCLCVALMTVVCAMPALLFPAALLHLINASSNCFILLLLLAMFAVGLSQSLQAWCIRVKAFKHTSASQVIRSLSTAAFWTGTGIGHTGAIGLVLGSICAEILASLNLSRVLKHNLKDTLCFVNWARMKQLAYEFRDFPAFAAPQNLMNALSQGLPVLLLGHFYGIEVAGSYAFGIRVLQAPMGFLLTPLRQVLFQKAAETHNQGGNLFPLFIKTTGSLIALALVPCIVLFIWAPQIFSCIFGSEWLEAGIYARWLVLWLFVGFTNVPSVLVGQILRQQRNLFLYECMILLSRTVVLTVGGSYWSTMRTIISFSVLGFILNAILIIWIGTTLILKERKDRQNHHHETC